MHFKNISCRKSSYFDNLSKILLIFGELTPYLCEKNNVHLKTLTARSFQISRINQEFH